ncbi:MAG: histidine kinase dimerization/phospho-acceptor domain-containing protein [Sphingomicrobium sp.]
MARGGETADRLLFDQAIAAVRSGAPSVDEQVRMAAARAIASLPAPLALISAFAADRLSVTAPVLAAARLAASDWSEVSKIAAPECRRFIASLRADAPMAAVPQPAPQQLAAEGDSAIPSISEVVARIERLRQSREHEPDQPPPEPAQPHQPPEPSEPPEPARLFRWECDESGEIAWVEGAPRGALIGRSIARGDEDGELDVRVERAFSLRMPFRDADFELAEDSSVGGSWKISGMPAFEPSSGRFAGYRGIAERERAEATEEAPMFPVRDPDSLRELAHEIKTPLNAIIGFAEIISGQYLGPADRPYRDRAQDIVAQARLLLTAIDDLDFAARLRSAGRGGVHQPRLGGAAHRRGVRNGGGGKLRRLRVAGHIPRRGDERAAGGAFLQGGDRFVGRAADVFPRRGRNASRCQRARARHGPGGGAQPRSPAGAGASPHRRRRPRHPRRPAQAAVAQAVNLRVARSPMLARRRPATYQNRRLGL